MHEKEIIRRLRGRQTNESRFSNIQRTNTYTQREMRSSGTHTCDEAFANNASPTRWWWYCYYSGRADTLGTICRRTQTIGTTRNDEKSERSSSIPYDGKAREWDWEGKETFVLYSFFEATHEKRAVCALLIYAASHIARAHNRVQNVASIWGTYTTVARTW